MNIQKLNKLVENLTTPRKYKKQEVWCGSGYIGIDWIPVNLKVFRELKTYIYEHQNSNKGS